MSGNNTSRRKFLGLVGGTATTLAGCNSALNPGETSDAQDTTPQEERSSREPEEQAAKQKQNNPEEFEEALKATSFGIQNALSRTHESPYDEEMVKLEGIEPCVMVGHCDPTGKDITLVINEDLGGLIEGATWEYDNADLYVATQFGLADEVLQDARSELEETTRIVDDQLGALQEEVEVPENYNLSVKINVHGRNGTVVSPTWSYGSSTADSEMNEVYQDARESGKGETFNSLEWTGNRDDVLALSEGDSETLIVDGDEVMFEYVETVKEDSPEQYGVLEIDGIEITVEDYESFSIDGETFRAESNPVYVQDREDVDDGVLIRRY